MVRHVLQFSILTLLKLYRKIKAYKIIYIHIYIIYILCMNNSCYVLLISSATFESDIFTQGQYYKFLDHCPLLGVFIYCFNLLASRDNSLQLETRESTSWTSFEFMYCSASGDSDISINFIGLGFRILDSGQHFPDLSL